MRIIDQTAADFDGFHYVIVVSNAELARSPWESPDSVAQTDQYIQENRPDAEAAILRLLRALAK